MSIILLPFLKIYSALIEYSQLTNLLATIVQSYSLMSTFFHESPVLLLNVHFLICECPVLYPNIHFFATKVHSHSSMSTFLTMNVQSYSSMSTFLGKCPVLFPDILSFFILKSNFPTNSCSIYI